MLERLGFKHLISPKIPGTKRVWIHALSVGEVKSALPLANAIQKQLSESLSNQQKNLTNQSSNSNIQSCYELIVTASTRTGFNMAQELFAISTATTATSTKSKTNKSISTNDTDTSVKAIQVGYFPFDLPFSVKSICSRIDPDMVIIVESDLWPGFLWHMRTKQVPVFLVNARLSQSSFDGYMLFKNFFSSVFCLFQTIMVQTELDKIRFVKIGIPEKNIRVTGNIKFDQPMPEIKNLDNLKANFGGKYFIAGSTHHGEEEIILSVFKELKESQSLKQMSEY
ncbi:MAG: hypothetical protein HQK67_05855, partial [Desulfamplus sp.]|nr:hypothetical protein [Desulfamplus sp.]